MTTKGQKWAKVDIDRTDVDGGVDHENQRYGFTRPGGYLVTSSMVWAFRNAMTNPQGNAEDQIGYFLSKLAKTGTPRYAAERCLEVFGMDDAGVNLEPMLAAYDRYQKRYL